jgi:glutathione S-transferase
LFPPPCRNPNLTISSAIAAGRGQARERLAAAPFAAGGRFSIADPMLLVFYRWGLRVGTAMDAYPAWSRFTAAMMQRPAVAAAFAAEGIVLG